MSRECRIFGPVRYDALHRPLFAPCSEARCAHWRFRTEGSSYTEHAVFAVPPSAEDGWRRADEIKHSHRYVRDVKIPDSEGRCGLIR